MLIAALFFGPLLRDLQPMHWAGLGEEITGPEPGALGLVAVGIVLINRR